jgi:FkbM family methyltransferase
VSIEGLKRAFSSHGEDVLLAEILSRLGITNGKYIEVGAFHPSMFSNTQHFYEMGWRGTLVEPNPFMAELLRQFRPDDNVMEVAAGKGRHGELLMFSDWGSSNTLDTQFAKRVVETQSVKITKRVDVDFKTLSSIFEKHVEIFGANVDFLSIDVEGMDLEVLASLDLEIYTPTLICIEDIYLDLSQAQESLIYKHLSKNKYRLISHNLISSVYLQSDIQLF